MHLDSDRNHEKISAAHPFVSGVESYIRRNRLLPPPQVQTDNGIAPTVIVALRGGADSVALLAVLVALGYNCRAAHCNFHLRGEESNRDMRHAAAICERLGVEMHLRHFTGIEKQCNLSGHSVEMVCRDLRYEWFDSLLDLDAAYALAVGHHAEDRAETFMLNLMRGTGIAGLTSMQPRRGSIIRPLLGCTRHEIEQFLDDCGLAFINDSSNQSDEHRRNRLRNRVFPLLEELFPGACESITHTISTLELTRAVYADAIDMLSAPYIDRPLRHIRLSALVTEQTHAAAILFELLHPLGFNSSQVADIIASQSGSGLKFRSSRSGTVMELDHGILTIFPDNEPTKEIQTECFDIDISNSIVIPRLCINVTSHPAAEFKPEGVNPFIAFIDADALEGSPRWQLRHPRLGDRMVPFGQKKSKLLSDIFANAHYSAAQKRTQWLLTRNDEIIWVPGLRNSASFTIGPQTSSFLRLEADTLI